MADSTDGKETGIDFRGPPLEEQIEPVIRAHVAGESSVMIVDGDGDAMPIETYFANQRTRKRTLFERR